MAVASTEREWLNAYAESLGYPEASKTGKYVYDRLIDSGKLRVDYLKTDLQQIAVFLLPRSGRELFRITTHTGGRKKGTSVSKYYLAAWDSIWILDFKQEFGFEPRMGHQITNWCLENPGNTDRLITWIVEHANEFDK